MGHGPGQFFNPGESGQRQGKTLYPPHNTKDQRAEALAEPDLNAFDVASRTVAARSSVRGGVTAARDVGMAGRGTAHKGRPCAGNLYINNLREVQAAPRIVAGVCVAGGSWCSALASTGLGMP